MKRAAAYVMSLGMALLPIDVDAQQARVIIDVRAELFVAQSEGASVMLELEDGSRVSGVVDRLDKRGCKVGGRSFAYSRVAAFLDPITEKPIAVVRRPSQTTKPFTAREYSTRTVVIVAVAVTVFLIWIRLAVPYT
jgi:hypothetical protein